MSERMLVYGATSGIGRALCHVLAARGCRLVVAGRDPEELCRTAADLRIRHSVPVAEEVVDACDFDSHVSFYDAVLEHLDGQLDCVVLCHGYMVDQDIAQSDLRAARKMIDVNFSSAVSLLELAAAFFERQGRGSIVAISSVAGDRGRQSNYTYGAAKAALTTFLAGLRHRLAPQGIHVLTVKPGFVDTPMTYGRPVPAALTASPDRVARDIDRALRRRREVLYTPWYWSLIMRVIRGIPEPIFQRLKL